MNVTEGSLLPDKDLEDPKDRSQQYRLSKAGLEVTLLDIPDGVLSVAGFEL
jgi:hypothetical protein